MAAPSGVPVLVPVVDGEVVTRRSGSWQGAIVDMYFAPGVGASSPTIANTMRWQTGEVERYVFHAELQLVPRGRRSVVVDYAALLRR